MGEKSLTWQQVVAVLCALAILCGALLALIPDSTRPVREIGWAAIAIFSALLVLLLIWHWRSVHRPDKLPDILGQLFQPGQLLQVGRAHFFIGAKQRAGFTHRVMVVVQNLRDGNGKFSLALRPGQLGLFRHPQVLSKPLPPVECELPPGGLVLLQLDIPLEPIDKPTELNLRITPAASARGQDVRFARRAAVQQPTSIWVGLLAALAGHSHFSDGTYLTLNCQPAERLPLTHPGSAPSELQWTATTIWTPQDPPSVEQVTATINRVLNEHDVPE
jgi:hypothetical protein